MHVLLIPSWYPTASNPLSGVFFRKQAEELQSAGVTVGVVVPPFLRSKRHLLHLRSLRGLAAQKDLTVENGIPVYRGVQWRWLPGNMQQANARLQVRAGLAMVEDYMKQFGRPDVIHAHSVLYGAVLAAKVSARHGIPVALTEHSTAYQRNLIADWQRPFVSSALRSVNCVTAVGDQLAAAMTEFAPEIAIDILPNGVDDEFFDFAPPPPTTSPFHVVSVGQLHPKKGMHHLIDAVAFARRKLDVDLSIAGSGAEHDALAAQVAALDLNDHVKLVGGLEKAGVRALFHRSHVVVSASKHETFGITMIEAMACGRPVIATRSGGPDSFVNSRNGLLVPVEDAGALCDAILTMAAHYAEYDGSVIRADCVSRFGKAATLSRLTTLYECAIAQERRSGV